MITFHPPIWHPSPDPETITRDGVTYDRIERLPRNVRPGDIVRLFDGNNPRWPMEAFCVVRDVDSWPRRVLARGRVSMAQAQIHLTDAPWWWAGHYLTFYGSETHRPFTIYRARKD